MASIEKYLENKFVEWCDEIGGKAFKGPAMQYKGFPDRFAILPNNGGTVYVEFKGGTEYGLTAMQKHFGRMITASDPMRYFVVDTKEDLAYLIECCKQFMNIGDVIVRVEQQAMQDVYVPKEQSSNTDVFVETQIKKILED